MISIGRLVIRPLIRALQRIQPDIILSRLSASPQLQEIHLATTSSASKRVEYHYCNKPPVSEDKICTNERCVSEPLHGNPTSWWLSSPIQPTHKFGSALLTGRIEIELNRLCRKCQCHHNRVNVPRLRLRLFLPRWLSCSVWESFTLRSQQGWTYHLRTYNILRGSKCALQFIYRLHERKLSSEEKLRGLQKSLENGEATIYDQTPYGVTLLHVS